MENKELISNEYYSLSELFSTPNRKIIIPDFQRDYCWGDKTHGEKNDTDIVSGFLDTLIEESKLAKPNVLIGKIDVYEHPKNHIYLTDGQQRLTSLYLLIGMLYKKVQNEELKKTLKGCLISDFEESHDDKEPYLQYAVRETTVFFLRDLVNEFFIKDNSLKVTDIQNQPWYFSEYKLDPSIISMLSALSIIEGKLNEKDIEFLKFSCFIINKVKIQYYDVKDKKHGEERFVIINTTGKSLTVSENIKPILLGNIENSDYAKQWEERETYFWKNRNKEKENIADNGVNEFLTWCFQIENKQENLDIIKKVKEILKDKKENEKYLKQIQTHFESLEKLIEYLKDDKFKAQFKFISDKEVECIVDLRSLTKIQQQNILLPLLAFISKFDKDKYGCYQFLRRLRKNYFDQEWADRKHNYVDWRYIVQIIEKSDSIENVLTFDNIKLEALGNIEIPQSVWFNDEEKLKSQLYDPHQLLEEWEDYSDFMGDLNPLFNVSEKSTNIHTLQSFYKIYHDINLDAFTYSTDIKLKNLFGLVMYLQNGKFDHRSVGGWGYCMLTETSSKRVFLLNDFNEIWVAFEKAGTAENHIFEFLDQKLKAIFKSEILEDNIFENVIENTRLLQPNGRVYLWCILEYLFTDEELKFDNNICQFWEYPNLLAIKSQTDQVQNDYRIGNLLLGTSYKNNKSGWVEFGKYPLMRELSNKRDSFTNEDIEKQSNNYLEKLKLLL